MFGASGFRQAISGVSPIPAGPRPSDNRGMRINTQQIAWLSDLQQGLQAAQQQHKGVLLDFSAAPM
jgi:hypothetical protein